MKIDADTLRFLQFNLGAVDAVGAGRNMNPREQLQEPSRGYGVHLRRGFGRVRQISCYVGCYTAL